MHTKNIDILVKIKNRFPQFEDNYNFIEKSSNEIILFGSYACGCEHVGSDVDILFVGNNRRSFSKYFDFIWVKPERLQSKTWLSSEIAIHIAKYGIWLKGDGEWRDKVFFSDAAITRKKQRIFERLIHIYLQKENLSLNKKKLFVQKVIINSIRLVNLYNKIPNPPTSISINEYINKINSFSKEIFTQNLLGKVGSAFFDEIFFNENIDDIITSSFNDMANIYLKDSNHDF